MYDKSLRMRRGFFVFPAKGNLRTTRKAPGRIEPGHNCKPARKVTAES